MRITSVGRRAPKIPSVGRRNTTINLLDPARAAFRRWPGVFSLGSLASRHCWKERMVIVTADQVVSWVPATRREYARRRLKVQCSNMVVRHDSTRRQGRSYDTIPPADRVGRTTRFHPPTESVVRHDCTHRQSRSYDTIPPTDRVGRTTRLHPRPPTESVVRHDSTHRQSRSYDTIAPTDRVGRTTRFHPPTESVVRHDCTHVHRQSRSYDTIPPTDRVGRTTRLHPPTESVVRHDSTHRQSRSYDTIAPTDRVGRTTRFHPPTESVVRHDSTHRQSRSYDTIPFDLPVSESLPRIFRWSLNIQLSVASHTTDPVVGWSRNGVVSYDRPWWNRVVRPALSANRHPVGFRSSAP